MTMVLQRILGKKVYRMTLVIIFLVTLFYQVETGFFPDQARDISRPETLSGTASDVIVVRVIDGDTFELSSGERVRLIGIDAPESVKPGTDVECFGQESSDFLRGFIERKGIRLESDRTDRDRYGRLLRYAYLGELFVNERIVREGYAESTAYRPDVRFQSVFDEAERQAKQERKGMWADGACSS